MLLREIYKSKLKSPDEAVKLIKDGWRVAVPVAVSQPPTLINALARRKNEFTHVELFTVVDVYATEMMNLGRDESIELDYSYCIVQRKGVQEGKYVYTPGRLAEVNRFNDQGRFMNVVMTQVAPMDDHGYFSLGLSCDYTLPFAKEADLVLVQVNENMPRTFGRNFLHISEVDAIIEDTVPLPALPSIIPNPNEELIGQYIADLIEDGSTIQLGIGGIPNAAALSLESKKDLGIHTEMVADSMRVLWEKGVINNSKKNFYPDIGIASFALGSDELYKWLDNNPSIHFYPVGFVNAPSIIAKNDRMISINSALEVDLSGQVASEAIGPVQYTHTGGQADFVLGAFHSKGGKSIIAFESVAQTKHGPVSKISSHLKMGSFVTTTRYDAQYIVTEYGVTNLKSKTIRQRAKNLISIAHPDFRDQLTFEARKANFL
jgi:4-hydroxybutyrate CoA-transferase